MNDEIVREPIQQGRIGGQILLSESIERFDKPPSHKVLPDPVHDCPAKIWIGFVGYPLGKRLTFLNGCTLVFSSIEEARRNLCVKSLYPDRFLRFVGNQKIIYSSFITYRIHRLDVPLTLTLNPREKGCDTVEILLKPRL